MFEITSFIQPFSQRFKIPTMRAVCKSWKENFGVNHENLFKNADRTHVLKTPGFYFENDKSSGYNLGQVLYQMFQATYITGSIKIVLRHYTYKCFVDFAPCILLPLLDAYTIHIILDCTRSEELQQMIIHINKALQYHKSVKLGMVRNSGNVFPLNFSSIETVLCDISLITFIVHHPVTSLLSDENGVFPNWHMCLFSKLINLSYIGDYSFDCLEYTFDFSNLVKLKHIGKNAFTCLIDYRPNFENMVNLTYIGSRSFYRLNHTPCFSNLMRLQHIGNEAFFHLSEMPILNGLVNLEYIGDGAFKNCIGTLNVSNLKSLDYIGSAAFYHATEAIGLADLTNLRHIGSYAFMHLTHTPGFDDFQMFQRLMHIGEYAFYNLKGRYNISGLVNLRHIGAYAFFNLSGTLDISSFKSLKHIGKCAFHSVNKILNITCLDSIQYVDPCAFLIRFSK